MTMKSNSEQNGFSPEDRNDKGSFQEHTDRMRIFYDAPGTCRVALTVSATGGSATPSDTADWLSLVPMWRMALRRFSPN